MNEQTPRSERNPLWLFEAAFVGGIGFSLGAKLLEHVLKGRLPKLNPGKRRKHHG